MKAYHVGSDTRLPVDTYAMQTLQPEPPTALRAARRTRRYGGFRARLATWLRNLAEWINPLVGP